MKHTNLAQRYWESLIDKVGLDPELLDWHDHSLLQRYWWTLMGMRPPGTTPVMPRQVRLRYDQARQAFNRSIRFVGQTLLVVVVLSGFGALIYYLVSQGGSVFTIVAGVIGIFFVVGILFGVVIVLLIPLRSLRRTPRDRRETHWHPSNAEPPKGDDENQWPER